MGSAKIRVKVGSIELDYEGDASFLDKGIVSLLQNVSELLGKNQLDEVVSQHEPSEQIKAPKKNTVGGIEGLSTTTVAVGLNVKSCGDLAFAALSKIQVGDGEDGASQKEILHEMKTATGHYKESMKGGNLTKGLAALVKSGRLNKLSNDRFSLRAAEKEKVELVIAELG